MKISVAFLAGTWLSTTIWTAFSTDTNIVHLIKSIPSAAICPEIICPEDSFVRRDDAGNCGCSNTGPGSNCDFIKCAAGPPIQNPVTGHCLCPPTGMIPPQPNCDRIACPLGGTAFKNSTLNSCACPTPPCLTKCYDGYRTGFDSTTGACTCIKEPLCPPEIVLCKAELSYGFSEVTLTCGCFPKALERPLESAPRQVPFKACDIFCKEETTLDTETCTCIPNKACSIFCIEGTTLDTATCTCIPEKACSVFCIEGTTLDTATCTCIPNKACNIFCREGTTLDTRTCTCISNNPILPPPPGINSNSSLPTPAGSCATFVPCREGQVAGFAPFTLECGCMNCDALHCPDYQQPKFDPTSQKCYCEGVPGKCFDLVCPPPGQQLVFQQVQNPNGTFSEECACNSKL